MLELILPHSIVIPGTNARRSGLLFLAYFAKMRLLQPALEERQDKLSDLFQFLYKIQPVRPEMLTDGPTPEEGQIVSEHFNYLKKLTDAGVVFMAGRTLNTDHSSFGMIIFVASSEEEARKIMQNDPAVKQRVMRAELYPYRVALLGTLRGE